MTTKNRCTAHKRDGTQCNCWAITGTNVCRYHGGNAPHVRANATIRTELLRWTTGTPHADPTETLLRLITQAANRADHYAQALDQLVTQHGGDLAAATIGDTLITTPHGEVIKAGEYIRGLTQLEAQERERLAKWCAQAIAAGIAERQVRLAERTGALIADVLRAVLGDAVLGLTSAQRAVVPGVMRRHIGELTG